ncbi:MAG: phosphoribosyltransferase [Deltaproteobacteria bacterium]|nr:phosphoribosyltransferase [Kofleriaceae bacterium]
MSLTQLHHAGDRLGRVLARFRDEAPVLLAIPRRGVVIGAQVARALGLPLDALLSERAYAPGHPEHPVGAVALGDIMIRDEQAAVALGVSSSELDATLDATMRQLRRRLPVIQAGRPLPELHDRTVIIIDDAAIEGLTMQVAIGAIAAHLPAKLIAAVPLCSELAARRLRPRTQELVYLDLLPLEEAAHRHAAIDEAICPPITDEQVHELLADARRYAPMSTEHVELDGIAADELHP